MVYRSPADAIASGSRLRTRLKRSSEYFYVPKKIAMRHQESIKARGVVWKRYEWVLSGPRIAPKAAEVIAELTGLDLSPEL